MWKTSLTHFPTVIKPAFNDTTLISERKSLFDENKQADQH